MTENNKKTGLFLCKCGTNIADFVDLDKVERWAEDTQNTSFIETHNLLCSPDGKKFFEEVLKENDTDNVVVAACSPKLHEKTFQDAAENAGFNMAMVQMANIREQCAWVTKDKEEATIKSKTLINAAINRSQFHEELTREYIDCHTDIVVIGGGVAGMEAAILAAKADRKVTIIEKEISLGGNVIKTEEIGPTMDCSPCVLAPRLSEINESENITVVSNAEVEEVFGFLGNFTVKVKKKARYIDDSCIGCEACFEPCPVSVKSDFHLGLGERKAIYTLFPGSVPEQAVIDIENCKYFEDKSCTACVESCPFDSINFDDQDEILELSAGAIILATGYEMVDLKGTGLYGYGEIDNVITLPEFDRITSSNGPFDGEIKLKNGQAPSSVAIIHCANSLNEDGLPYCSGVCCMTALKAGELIRHQYPEIKVFNIHDRLVFTGEDIHTFYQKQMDNGTVFLKTNDLVSVDVTKKNGTIRIGSKDFENLNVDMVILSTGMKPSSTINKIAEMTHTELSETGFLKADHSILNAIGTSIDGIYAAGSCASPCTVSTAITRAQATTGEIISQLIPGKQIELEILTSVIDEEICAGCKMCNTVCPYTAISYDGEKVVSVINEAICRGCGTCAATCPSGAITAKHFTDKQIYAELEGLIYE